MARLPDDLPECMVFLLGKAYQKAHADFKKRLTPYGLTNLQHLVLEALWYNQGVTAAQLSKLLILDKATLSGILERLAAAGWIRKEPHPEDRRTQCISTTDKANRLKTDLIDQRKKANEQILEPFSMEEKILFKRLLKDMVNSD